MSEPAWITEPGAREPTTLAAISRPLASMTELADGTVRLRQTLNPSPGGDGICVRLTADEARIVAGTPIHAGLFERIRATMVFPEVLRWWDDRPPRYFTIPREGTEEDLWERIWADER